MGIEPMTNGLLDQRSTDWAMRPNEKLVVQKKKISLENNKK